MKKSQSLVSIIIVTFNGKKHLEKCLPTITKQSYQSLELIVIDNNSIDGTVEWLRTKYPKTIIIKNTSNTGYADANNQGYRKAKGQYIYFLNNDTTLKPDAIAEMVKVLDSDKQIGGVQSKLLLMERKDTLDTIGAFLTPTGFLFHNHFGEKDRKDYDQQIPLYTAKGASMMFKRMVLQKIMVNGWLFDPDYFAYFEETDLCHRIWLSGFQIVYAYKAVVFHTMGATSSKMNQEYIQYHSFKNRIATYMKNIELSNLIPLLLNHFLVVQLYAFAVLAKGKYSLWLAIQRSIWWNIRSLEHTKQKRKQIFSTIKKVSDTSVLPLIWKSPNMHYYQTLFFQHS